MAPRLNVVALGGAARHRLGTDRANAWITPAHFVREIRRAHGGSIDLDPCTEPSNPVGALRYYTAADDGLMQPWNGRVFVNPPYSPLAPWIDAAIRNAGAGAKVYMLIPVRTDAPYHHRLIAAATDILFVAGRLRFTRADGSPSGVPAFGSMVVGLGVSTQPLSHLGTILVPRRSPDAA